MQIDNEEIEAPKLRPAVYLRVSTEDQGNKYGLKIQEDAITNFIKNRFDYDENNIVFYKDIGISGTLEYKKRPQLNKLFEDIKYAPNGEPPFDVVVVYKIDRFARDLKVLLEIIGDLKESNVSFASTQELIDTSTPFGKAMLGILGVFAELDRDMIVMKTHEGIDKALSSGVAYREVFGYKKDKSKRLIIHQEQAEIVKRIFYMFTELNYPISKIAETLSNEKIPIAVAWDKDNFVNKNINNIYAWKDGPLRVILSNEIYTGKHYYHKQLEIKDKITGKKTVKKLPKEEWKISKHFHDPIIDNLTFEKAEKLLNVKKGNFKSSSEYILGGLIKCDHCKEYRKIGMVSWTGTSSNGGKYYICSGKNPKKYPDHQCSTIPLPKDELEEIVKNEMKNIILNPDAIEKHIDYLKGVSETEKIIKKDLSKINNKIDKLNNKFDELDKMFSDPNFDLNSQEYRRLKDITLERLNIEMQKRSDLEIRLSQTVEKEKQMKAMEYVNNSISNLENIFNDDDKCKELFNILIDDIVMYSEEDKSISITGRKKKGGGPQIIPKGIIINFKLPQEFLNDILVNDNLRGDIKEMRNNF